MGSRGSEYERGALILSCALVSLKVNWPEGPREGGLGHWFLSGHPERNPPSADGGIPLRHSFIRFHTLSKPPKNGYLKSKKSNK